MPLTPAPRDPREALVHPAHADRLRADLELGLDRLIGRLAGVRAATPGTTSAGARALARRIAGTDLDRPGVDLATALDELDELWLRDAVWFHEPGYAAHLNCPVVAPAVLAELMVALVNPSIDTVDQSMGATFVEQRLIAWTAGRLGFDADHADGVFTPGGTTSNLHGLHLARDEARERTGAPLERMRVIASVDAHMSVDRAARLLGLPADAVLAVPVDHRRRMDPGALARCLDAVRATGLVPMAVVATAGTTDHGAIDPLPRIAAIAAEHRAWLHVDAAYGGGLLLSTTHRHRLEGIEHADSVTVDFHKTFFQPVACSALVVRTAASLRHVAWHADYLNPADAGGADELPGDQVAKSLQTTRRFDPLKLWLSLRVLGADTLGAYVDRIVDLAAASYRRLADEPHLELRTEPELTTLLLRYTAPGLDDAALDDLVPRIRAALAAEGRAVVAATRVEGRRWLKLTLLNPLAEIEDVVAIGRAIVTAGHALAPSAAEVEVA